MAHARHRVLVGEGRHRLDFELLGIATLNYAEALAAQGDLARAESLAAGALGFSTGRTDGHRGKHGESEETLALAGQYHNLLRMWAAT